MNAEDMIKLFDELDPEAHKKHTELVNKLVKGENIKFDRNQFLSDFKTLTLEKMLEKYDFETIVDLYESIKAVEDAERLFKERIAGGLKKRGLPTMITSKRDGKE